MCPEGDASDTQPQFSIASTPAEIWRRHLPNISLEQYDYNNPFGKSFNMLLTKLFSHCNTDTVI